MLSFILSIIVFFIILAVIIVAIVAVFIFKGVRIFKKATNGANGNNGRRRQYTYNNSNEQRKQQRNTHTDTGETIIDNRDQATAKRKIFADNEGEYTDYEEEH